MGTKVEFEDPHGEGVPEWKWSACEGGFSDPPPVGTRVKIVLNGWSIGGSTMDPGDIPGTLVGYKVSAGWLTAVVEADFLPYWRRQETLSRVAFFAGRELQPL